MRSIRRELLAWLLAGLLVAVAVAAVGTYLRAREEANALFDHQLQEMVASLIDAPFAAAPEGVLGSGAGEDALVVQIWDRNGVQLYLSQPQRVLPRYAQLGFTNLRTESGEWRVFSALAGGQVVQVAQPMHARRELAASMALRTIVPLLAVLPVLGLLIWFIIARGLEPLERVAAAVGRRSSTALEPLSERGLPSEVRPLVHALNGLLDRLGQALTAQRTFIADAAHELRTPLTAVHLQAQLAERATTDA
jgi:two-component system OmpR family sensor kinase